MEIPSGFAVILREYLMLKKLMSATALGVVLSAGAGMTAQAQVVTDCQTEGPFDVVDENGVPLEDINGNPTGEQGDGFECGQGSSAGAVYTQQR